MPIYVKRCACGKTLEILCRYTDSTPCPTCGKEMQRVPVAGSFDLRGDGWYRGGRQ